MAQTKVFRRKNDQAINETWAPILKEYGVNESRTDLTAWLSEYAHNHASFDNSGSAMPMMNESVNPGMFFQQPGSISYMGQPVAPTAAQFPVGGQQGFAANSGSGDKFPSLLPIAIQVAAKTIGFDLVSVIPMDAPVGFIPYLDYVYAGGRTDTEFPSFLIKLSMMDPATVLSDATTLSALTVGDEFTVVNSGAQITLRFVGFSRADGAVVFRVISLAAATINAAFVAGGVLTKTVGGATITLTSGNNLVELVSALENHISGFTSTDETAATLADATQNWSGSYLPEMSGANMTVPNGMTRAKAENAMFRQMGLKMFTKFVEAEGDQVAISATIEQIQDFNRVWNFDVISMLENVATNEIAQSINKRLVGRLFELGYIHNQEINKVEGAGITNLSLMATGGFENVSTLQRRVVTKVLEMANLIYHRSRWGAGEYIVTNGRLAAVLADVAGYSLATAPIKSPSGPNQLYPATTVYGLQVYVDPNLRWGDNKMLIGRKGKEEEPGLKFMPYIMAESLQTISEGTMSPKIGVKSRYAITEAGWHPETQYALLSVTGIDKLTGSANPFGS